MTRPKRNQHSVENLLNAHRANIEGCCVVEVTLGNGVALVPERSIDAHGYRITLHTNGGQYQVVAQLVEFGRTGFLSFYLNDRHILKTKIEHTE